MASSEQRFRPAPPTLWDRPDMAKALARRDIGQVLKIFRRHTGMSQTDVGILVYMSQSRISDLERGRSQVAALEVYERVADGLGIPRERLGLSSDEGQSATSTANEGSLADRPGQLQPIPTRSPFSDTWTRQDAEVLADQLSERATKIVPDDALQVAHEWLVAEPPQVYEIRAGSRVTERLLQKVESRVNQLRRMDDFIGGGDSYELVTRELQATTSLLREGAYSQAAEQRLLSVVGQLCQLAGWVASDAGRHTPAERFYLNGLQAARSGGDDPLAGNLLSSLAYQVANIGDPNKAALLASTAQKGAEHSATPTVQALLWERVAWAHAKAGRLQACLRALGQADQAYDRSRSAEDPLWVYWLDRTEIDVMAGRCLVELQQPARAEPLLQRALATYDQSRARESALYLTWLADAYIQSRDVDQAATTASQALTLSLKVASARSADRVHTIQKRLQAFNKASSVKNFNEHFRSVTTDDPPS